MVRANSSKPSVCSSMNARSSTPPRSSSIASRHLHIPLSAAMSPPGFTCR